MVHMRRFMKPKTAGAVPASLPAKVQRRFDLAPSPPQQKLRPQSPLPKSGARNPQRRSLFPAAAARPAGAAAPASAAAPAAAAACRRSPAAAAPQPAAQPEVDPIAAWDAQQGAASAPAADSEGQSPDLQRSPGAVEPAAAAAAEPASDIEIDLDGEVEPPCDERRDGGAASTALGSAALSQPPCQPSSGQGNAAALFGGAAASGSQRAGASTAEQGPQAGSLAGDMARPDESGAAVASAQPAAAEGWMPSSLSEVHADEIALPQGTSAGGVARAPNRRHGTKGDTIPGKESLVELLDFGLLMNPVVPAGGPCGAVISSPGVASGDSALASARRRTAAQQCYPVILPGWQWRRGAEEAGGEFCEIETQRQAQAVQVIASWVPRYTCLSSYIHAIGFRCFKQTNPRAGLAFKIVL